MKIKYYKDADLLSLRVSNKPYYGATRADDLVVHYTKDGKPVLVEILNASEFLKEADKSLTKNLQKTISRQSSIAIPHKIK